MLTKRISVSIKHNPKRAESNPESMIGKLPTYLWLGLHRFGRENLPVMMQMGRLSYAIHLKKHYCSPNPALDVRHHQEPIATDYVSADVPAVDDGSMGAQIFVGTEFEVCDVLRSTSSVTRSPTTMQK